MVDFLQQASLSLSQQIINDTKNLNDPDYIKAVPRPDEPADCVTQQELAAFSVYLQKHQDNVLNGLKLNQVQNLISHFDEIDKLGFEKVNGAYDGLINIQDIGAWQPPQDIPKLDFTGESPAEVQPDSSGKKSEIDIKNDIDKMEKWLKQNGGTGAIDGTVDASEIRKSIGLLAQNGMITNQNRTFWAGVAGRMEFEQSQTDTNYADHPEFIKLDDHFTANAAAIYAAQAQNDFIAQGGGG